LSQTLCGGQYGIPFFPDANGAKLEFVCGIVERLDDKG